MHVRLLVEDPSTFACNDFCVRLPPECHHEKREPHKCHFGDCPPCRQICKKIHGKCGHECPVPCHSSVLVKIEAQKGSMPWENTSAQMEKKALPCPDCQVPVPITCFGNKMKLVKSRSRHIKYLFAGKHETFSWPCYIARPSSCHKKCGRLLTCGNHACDFECHVVEEAHDDVNVIMVFAIVALDFFSC